MARSLSLSRSIAVGVTSAVLLAVAGYGAAAEEAAARLVISDADAARGRVLFVSKGCIACHAINEVGGSSAPPLDVAGAPGKVDPLDFVARMWRGAEAMIFMQQQDLGEQLDLTGQELADIIAFVHDPEERQRFSEANVPPTLRRMTRDE